MEKGWIKIYDTANLYQAELYKGLLEDHDIQSIIINKQDSVYISVGEIELYVKNDDAVPAIHLINKSDLA